MKTTVYVVLENQYYNEEYWDVATSVEKIFSSKEKAKNYVENIPDAVYIEELDEWKIGDEDVDAYAVKWFEIQEVEIDD